MTNKKSVIAVLRRVLLCFVVIFMVQQAVVPAPAHAQIPIMDFGQKIAELVGWIKKAAQYVMKETAFGKIIMQLFQILTLLTDKFGALLSSIKQSGAMQFMAKILQARASEAHTNYMASVDAAANRAAALASYAANHAKPPHQELCKSIMITQLTTTTEDFEREVSRIVTEAVSNRERCPGCNGNGGSHADLELDYRMQNKWMDAFDGIPKGVDMTGTKGTAGGTLYGADAGSFSHLQVYEMPALETQTYTDPITKQTVAVRSFQKDKLTSQQKFFMAQVNSLFHMAGSRPTPLSGAQLFTQRGMVQRAMFNHCAANENVLIKQCADRLAYYTRPNSKDPSTGAALLRKTQKDLCMAMTGTIDKTQYANCEEGLSSYETQELALRWCESIQSAAGHKMAGARDNEVTAVSDICSMARTTFRSIVAQKERNCSAAKAAINGLAQCWNTVNALGPQGATAENTKNSPEYLARWRTLKDNDGLSLPSFVMQVKATKLKRVVPQGQPISMDEVELPTAVGQ